MKKGKKKGKGKKDEMEIIEEEDGAPTEEAGPTSKKKSKHLDVASNRRAVRYSKIIDKVHKTNPLLKRTREFNR